MTKSGEHVLIALGRRARLVRIERGWTIRDVAERSGVSPRFLVQVEAGKGNISVRRLADLASALQTSPAMLLSPVTEAGPEVIALLGLSGAGKTSIGKRLARRLRVAFVELDQRVEEAAHMSLSELFALHGEQYYRQLERGALEALLQERRPVVVATGGGLVTSNAAYELLRRHAVTVWLRARPEDHWNRVLRQGDRRPMANHPQAMADLRALLAAREPLYAAADHTIDTSGMTVPAVVDQICGKVTKPDLTGR